MVINQEKCFNKKRVLKGIIVAQELYSQTTNIPTCNKMFVSATIYTFKILNYYILFLCQPRNNNRLL